MTRIAHVATVDVTLKTLLAPQVRYLLGRGFEVEMIASAGPHTPALREEGFIVHNVPISRRLEPWKDLRSALELARLFRRERYTIVHTHTSKAGFVGRLAARRAKVPLVVHTVHGFFFHENMPPLQRRVFEGIERVAARWTDLMFTQSLEDYHYVLSSGMLPAGRVRYLGNGIDVSLYDPARWNDGGRRDAVRKQLVGEGDYIVALMVAFMIERKGHPYLLEAVERLRPLHNRLRILLAGDGPLEPALRRFVRERGMDDVVRFLGYRDDVPALMAASDLFVLPSLSEGMPRSVLEAMAMQLPVIASAIRGSREIVLDGRTGLLVPAGDSEALAGALEQLVRDDALRAEMGRAGRARVLEEFDERLVFERLEKGYQEMLALQGAVSR